MLTMHTLITVFLLIAALLPLSAHGRFSRPPKPKTTKHRMADWSAFPKHKYMLKYGCETHREWHKFSTADHDRALTKMMDWCERGNVVNPGEVLAWEAGEAQAFVCNWAAGEQGCSRNETVRLYDLTEMNCFENNLGWDIEVPLWRKGIGVYSIYTNPRWAWACRGGDSWIQ